jgi:hypothetical protein
VTLLRLLASTSSTQAAETQSALIRVERKLDQNIRTHVLLIQALHRCYSEFRPFLLFIFLGHIKLINFLLSNPQLSLTPEESPIYIEDPNRRILTFLRSNIRDWDDFDTLLMMQFKREASLEKTAAGEYVLHDLVRNKMSQKQCHSNGF